METKTPSGGHRYGRPPKGPAPKRASFNTRIRSAVKESLDAAAREAGRSLSEEIEKRLDESLLGGRLTAAFLRELAAGAQAVGGENWLDDYAAFQAVRQAWNELLDRREPPRPEEVDERIKGARAIAEVINLAPGEFPPSLDRGALITMLRVMTRGLPAADRAEFIAKAAAADAGENTRDGTEATEPEPKPGFAAMGWIPGRGR